MGSCTSRERHERCEEDASGNNSQTEASLVAEKAPLGTSSSLVTSTECRMCLEEQIFNDDPIIQLGCMCLGNMGLAHESCIRKWFPQRFLDTGRYDCEICKSKLGDHATSIIMQNIHTVKYKYMFRQRIAQILQAIEQLENKIAWLFVKVLIQASDLPQRR